MNLTATQIEDIVRVVVERLRTGVAPPKVSVLPTKIAEAPAGELHLSGRVISLESLKDQLGGAKTIVVHPKSIVTPAVKDLLRQQSIRLVRQLPNATSMIARSAPLVLVISEAQHPTVSKRVCSQQATTMVAGDATATVSAIEQNLADGKLGAVWCSDTPFACVAATYGHASLRAMQLFDLQGLSRAIEQAQPNVLILDCRTWNAPAITNLVRNWFRSLR